MLLTEAVGGPTAGDAQQSVYAAWAIAHGHVGCAYPPTSVAGYTPTAPVYVLVSAALVAVFQVGSAVSFPGAAQLGAHCASASQAITVWSFHVGALHETLRFGYVAWFVLAAGVVAALRATGRGRCGWEPLALFVVACLPPVVMCLAEFFHPQDLIATGLSLFAIAAVRKDRWVLAGVALGLAVISQQLAILVAVPLVILVPARHRARLFVSAGSVVVVVAAALGSLTGGRALPTVLVGTGTTSVATSILTEVGAHGGVQFAVSRIVPLALAGLLAQWTVTRLGDRALGSVPLLSIVATSLALRLPFDVAIWGYYLAPAAVFLVVLDVTRGRLRVTFLAWVVVVAVASLRGVLVYAPGAFAVPLWLWQVVIDGGAVALAVAPLLGEVSAARSAEATGTGIDVGATADR